MTLNPYTPPAAPLAPADATSAAEAARAGQCPRCKSQNVHQPSFTWWGGVIGPKLFKHTICRACGFGFNRETGLANRNKIVTYTIVVSVLAVGVVLLYMNNR
jgi:hypothetical protein